MYNLNFACTACGRCCYGSFSPTVDEALRLGAELPLAVGVVHSRGPSKNPSPAQGKAERRYIIRYTLGDNRTVWLMPRASSLNPHTRPCPFLTPDRLCGLQGDAKPMRCRTMPLYQGTDPSKGVMSAITSQCPPEVHDGPALIRAGRVVDSGYAAAANAELALMERDLEVVGLALLYAAWVFDDVRDLVENPSRRSDIFAASPAFLALSACGQGRWTLDQGADFCEAQVGLLERLGRSLRAEDPAFGRRVAEFATAASVVGRDLREGGGYSMQNWREFKADADGKRTH